MAFSSMALSVAGAASSAVGNYYSASSRKIGLGAQADIADSNARLAELEAQAAMESGAREEQQARLATAQLKSSQRAGLAANGVDLGVGSAARVLSSTDIMGEADAIQIKQNTVRETYAARQQRTNYENEARSSRAAASAINPGMEAATSLLGSAGGLADRWYTYKKAGAFDKPKKKT